MSFAESGKYSQAWWLQQIKSYGNKGVPGIMRGAEASTYKVNSAILDLEDSGYVQRHGKATRGRGNTQTFTLTSIGHRYLNENELEAVLDEPYSPEPKQHDAVPTNVVHPVGEIADVPLRHIPTSEPVFALKASDITVTEQAPKPAQPSAIPKPLESSQPAPGTVSVFREALVEILIERFADQVTAREVLDRLERTA